jgi:hypothetical protein
MSRRIVAIAFSAVAALAVLVVGLAGARGAGADEGGEGLALLHRAGSQAAKLGFDGTVVVRWRDGSGWHRQSVPVHMDDGVLRMGDDRLVSAGARRLLRTDAGWQLMWAGRPKGSEPDPARKYRFVVSGPTTVADRPAVEVDVRRDGASHAAERLVFDRDTGVLLRRDQLDEQGRLTRTFAFVQMTAPVPAHPAKPGDVPSPTAQTRGATPHALAGVPDDLTAPNEVGHGFELAGVYSQPDGSAQLYYSDGLFGLSVFERAGDLVWGSLPAGGRTEQLGDIRVRAYRTGAGTALVWGSDDVTYTCVTDAPMSEVRAVAEDLSPSSSDPLEDVGHFVTAPFSWG